MVPRRVRLPMPKGKEDADAVVGRIGRPAHAPVQPAQLAAPGTTALLPAVARPLQLRRRPSLPAWAAARWLGAAAGGAADAAGPGSSAAVEGASVGGSASSAAVPQACRLKEAGLLKATAPRAERVVVEALLATHCSCGNILLDDSLFCRMCGAPRLQGRGSFESIEGAEDPARLLLDHPGSALVDAAGPQDRKSTVAAMMLAASAVQTLAGRFFLDLPGFEHLCIDVLDFQLAQSEVADVFGAVDSDGDGYISSRDVLEHCDGGRHRVLLLSMLHVFRMYAFNKNYEIPASYDFTRPTNDPEFNHGSRERCFVGRFRDIRERLDFNYHGGYTKSRQAWQDAVVSSVMLRSEPKAMPWLVYTCGGYGTGKGFCMAWMSEQGLFPLTDVVCVDPDQFKKVMPEWEQYVKRGEEAGSLCHAESAYMEEMVQALAMRNRQNIWIDGSLWNTEWYKGVFLDLKEQYPHYRLALFYIFASEARALARVEARSRSTGRSIPGEKVTTSLAGARSSVMELTPYVDFVARIDNDGETPILRSVEVVDRSGSWESIARRFARQQPTAQDFPRALAPLSLRAMPDEVARAMTFVPGTRQVQLDLARLCREADPRVLCAQVARLLEAHLPGCLELDASAPWPVTADVDMRRMVGVPNRGEADCCFVYQQQSAHEADPLRTRDFIKASSYRAAEGFPALVELLKYGGFLYLDAATGVVLAASCISKRPGSGMLQFGQRQPLPQRPHEELTVKRRWHPVTLGRLRGARQFAWITPWELLAGVQLGGAHGAMAFVLEDGEAWVFPISPFTQEGGTPYRPSRQPRHMA